VPVDLDLTAFSQFSKRILVAEGTDPAMQVSATTLEPATEWQHTLPVRGGFILRLDEK
jgi:hypothetical protein